MSSYLEAYGAAEEQRARRLHLLKNSSIALACVLAVALVGYGLLKNRSEEQQAKSFLSLLQSHSYPAAYALWGCSETHPCPDYPFPKFLEDWGPASSHADASSAHIGQSDSCGSGVLIRLDYKTPREPVLLWVERGTKIISFAPWAECPGRHWHIAAFFRSLFSR